jgi:nucleoside 2-deoxyribosyltransferase
MGISKDTNVKIYFAGPLFSEAEMDWIRSTIRQIESVAVRHGRNLKIIFPYDLITQPETDGLGKKAKHKILSRCKSHLDDADLVIALLDGAQVDDGTAWEIGYFYGRRPPEKEDHWHQDGFSSSGRVRESMRECHDRRGV